MLPRLFPFYNLFGVDVVEKKCKSFPMYAIIWKIVSLMYVVRGFLRLSNCQTIS